MRRPLWPASAISYTYSTSKKTIHAITDADKVWLTTAYSSMKMLKEILAVKRCSISFKVSGSGVGMRMPFADQISFGHGMLMNGGDGDTPGSRRLARWYGRHRQMSLHV
jgi:hypothetical protein